MWQDTGIPLSSQLRSKMLSVVANHLALGPQDRGLAAISAEVARRYECGVPTHKTGMWKLIRDFYNDLMSLVQAAEALKQFHAPKPQKPKTSFYDSPEWRRLRYQALCKFGRRCMCCGTTNKVLHVDHIRPRSKHPELALVLSNLQVLCEDCNMGKGAWDQTDWRPKPPNGQNLSSPPPPHKAQ